MSHKKLGDFIEKTHIKFSTLGVSNLPVFGVSNTDGITTTSHKKSADLSNYLLIESQFFAYNPYRINVGSIGLTKEVTRGLVSPAYVVFQIKDDSLVPEFLFDFLKSSEGLRQINKKARGTVRKALRYEDLCEIEIPSLTYKEQMDFKELKKKFDTEIDRFEQEITNQESLLKKLRQAILQEAISGKLTADWRAENPNPEPASELLARIKAEKAQLIADKKIRKEKPLPEITPEEIPFDIPESWEYKNLGDLSYIVRGSSPRPKGDPAYWSEDRTPYHWVTIADFSPYSSNGKLVDTKGYLTRLGSTKSRLVSKGDLIVACSGVGSVGRSTEMGVDGFIYDGLLGIRYILSENLKLYLKIFLKHKESSIYDVASGANWLNINIDILRNYKVPLPPISEQVDIIKKVASLMSLCDEMEQEIQTSKQHAQDLLQSVLREAFNPNVE